MKTRWLIMVILVFFPAWTFSEETDDDPLTLSTCLKEAALNNPQLQAAFENWKAALEQIPQAKSLDDPKFTFSYFIEEVETRVGPMDSKMTLMQTFPWFGKLAAREDAATAAANAARQRYEMAKLKLFYDVKKSFYEYSYLFTAIDIAQENLALLNHFEQVVQTKYKTAAASHPDIIRVQIELATLEDVLASLKKLQDPLTAQLNALMNRPAGSSLPGPQAVPFTEVALDRDTLIQTLVSSNPELAGLDWQIEASKHQVELAQKRFYPDIGIGVDWTQIGSAVNPAMAGSGQDAVALMFSINIPLWQGNYSAGQRQAEAMLRQSRQQKASKQNDMITRAVSLLYDIEDNQRKTNLYGGTLLGKADELIQTAESAYRAGTVDFLSLIDAQRMQLRYRLDDERAKVNYQQKIAELEMLIGRDMTVLPTPMENNPNENGLKP